MRDLSKEKFMAFRYPNIPPIPQSRLIRTNPFQHCGIDYFGPVQIRNTDSSKSKIWVMLTTCMVTRAIHLKIVHDNSTHAFLLAFRRTIARRGCPSQIVLDNAPAFCLGLQIIQQDIENHANQFQFISFLATHSIEIQHIAPFSPWFSGFYERLVGVVKSVRYKTNPRKDMTYVEFNTLICELEAIVNARPITTKENLRCSNKLFKRSIGKVSPEAGSCGLLQFKSLFVNCNKMVSATGHAAMFFNIAVWLFMIFGISDNIRISAIRNREPSEDPSPDSKPFGHSEFPDSQSNSIHGSRSFSRPARSKLAKREYDQGSVVSQTFQNQDVDDFEYSFSKTLEASSNQKPSGIQKPSDPVADIPLETVVEQLEITEYFTNALILTEAIHKGLTNISIIATDLMIIGHMKDEKEWLQKLESTNIDAATVTRIEGLFNKLKPLQDIIEKGEPIDISLDVTDSIISAWKNVEVVEEVLATADWFNSIIDGYKEHETIDFDLRKDAINMILQLPAAIKAFSKFSETPSLYSEIETGYKVIKAAMKANVHAKLKSARFYYEDYESDSGKFAYNMDWCVSNLTSAVKTLPVGAITASFQDVPMFFNLFRIAKDNEQVRSVINNWKIPFKQFELQLERIQTLSESPVFPKRKFDSFLATIEKTVETELNIVGNTLRVLRPLAEIVGEFKNLLLNNGQATTESKNLPFIQRFKSYRGLPHGIENFNLLPEKSQHLETLPPEINLSGIVERTKVIESCSSHLTPIIPTLINIVKVVPLSEISVEISNILNASVTDNIRTSLNSIVRLFENPPRESEPTKKFLNAINVQMEALGEKDLSKDLEALTGKITEKSSVMAALESLFSNMKAFVNFTAKIKNAVKGYNPQETNVTIKRKNFVKIEEMFADYPSGMDVVERFEKSWRGMKLKQFDEVVKVAKEQLKVDLAVKSYNLPENEFPIDEIEKEVVRGDEIQTTLRDILDGKQMFMNFKSDVSKFEALNAVAKKETVDGVETAVDFLKGFSKMNKSRINTIESDAISKLMEGTSFGSGVLEKLNQGVSWYQSLVAGTESVKIVNDAVERMKRTGKGLMERVGRILKGFELIQLSTQSDLNVSAILGDIPTITNNSEKVKKWIDGVDAIELEKIETELKRLAAKTRKKRQASNDTRIIHGFILAVQNQKNKNSGQLSDGLRSLVQSLSYVNCKKNPSHLSCLRQAASIAKQNEGKISDAEGEKNNTWIFILIGCVVALIVFAVVAIFFIRKFLAKGKNDKTLKKYLKEDASKIVARGEVSMTILGKDVTFHSVWLSKAPKFRSLSKYAFAIQMEFCSLSTDYPKIITYADDGHRVKNRPLFEHNTIKIDGSDSYPIHAGRITHFKEETYIAMQAPTHEKNYALFRLLDIEESATIVQLCGDNEPPFSAITYKHFSDRFEVFVKKSTNLSEFLVHNELSVKDVLGTQEEKVVNHYHVLNWPDRRAPEEVDTVLQLLNIVREEAKQSCVVVHCQAGSGRTGTFIALAHVCCEIDNGKQVKVNTAIETIRKDRYGAVQSPIQVAFLQLAAQKYIVNLETVNKEVELKKFKKLFNYYKSSYDELLTPMYELVDETKKKQMKEALVANAVADVEEEEILKAKNMKHRKSNKGKKGESANKTKNDTSFNSEKSHLDNESIQSTITNTRTDKTEASTIHESNKK